MDLGSDNENLPTFIVLVSKKRSGSRCWPGYGAMDFFLPCTRVFNSVPVKTLYYFLAILKDMKEQIAREMLDYLRKLNKFQLEAYGDPEINTRIAQYEMAYRMQTSVPEVMDLSDEPDHIFEMYGKDSRDPGTYAANCLMARRLLEKDVKFVQIYHQGWDQHSSCPEI